jgi:UDP-N-acetylglucosamine acyltransferase
MTGFHQFTRIGRLALVSALSAANRDIPPYVTCGGRPATAIGINLVGLRRAGIPEPVRREIREAFKYLYRSGLTVPKAVEKIKADFTSPEIQHLVQFIENSKRGVIGGAKDGEGFFLAKRDASLMD